MQSPFIQVLHTSYSPSVLEATQIVDLCSESAAEVERLNAEIGKLQETLNTLISQRDAIQNGVALHHALSSPVRQLPTEILQRIFALCRHSRRNPVMHHSEAPLLLGRICSRWRSISVGTPELWDSVHAVSERLSKDGRRNISNADGVVAWLQRSGDHIPLNISLYTPPPEQHHSDPDIVILEHLQILPTITPYARRWKCIELEMPPSELTALQVLESKDVPLLETFAFRVRGGEWLPAGGGIDNLGFLGTAPRLTRFLLHDYPEDISGLQLPWGQLNDLHLDNPCLWDSNSFFRIFAGCSRLQRCTLTYATRPHDDVPISSIILPSLQNLYFRGGKSSGGFNNLWCCLNFLTLPNLQSLEIDDRSYDRVIYTNPPLIASLLLRSSCSLTKLDLGRAKTVFEAKSLTECLQLTPELQELVFSSYIASNVIRSPTQPELVMESLTVVSVSASPSSSSESTIPLCPVLRTVSIYELRSSFLPTLLAFLRSRMGSGACTPLESAHLVFRHPLEINDRAKVEGLAEISGTHITVIDPPPPPTAMFAGNRWTGLNEDSENDYDLEYRPRDPVVSSM